MDKRIKKSFPFSLTCCNLLVNCKMMSIYI
jgi:hypothetical protein